MARETRPGSKMELKWPKFSVRSKVRLCCETFDWSNFFNNSIQRRNFCKIDQKVIAKDIKTIVWNKNDLQADQKGIKNDKM